MATIARLVPALILAAAVAGCATSRGSVSRPHVARAPELDQTACRVARAPGLDQAAAHVARALGLGPDRLCVLVRQAPPRSADDERRSLRHEPAHCRASHAPHGDASACHQPPERPFGRGARERSWPRRRRAHPRSLVRGGASAGSRPGGRHSRSPSRRPAASVTSGPARGWRSTAPSSGPPPSDLVALDGRSSSEARSRHQSRSAWTRVNGRSSGARARS